MFCDKVSIYVKAGDGGNGRSSFLHEKYREFGGPDGGDGGKGGDVIFEADENLNTLYFFKTHHKLIAKNGENGKAKKQHGKNAPDLVIKVPKGTVVIDEETGEIVGDLSDASKIIVARGGEGGYGNAHFISSTRQAPKVAEMGEPGEEKRLTLELKMIANVGIVGLPNVGKSTLLSVISAARPKIADYEFTTLIPNLGVVEEGKFGLGKGFIVADIPGLIEGASKGKGLGDEFLRHVERTQVLIHLLDATHPNLAQDYLTILNELKYYKVDLSEKPQIVAVNKVEVLPPEVLIKKIRALKKVLLKNHPLVEISAVTHKNLDVLLHLVEASLREQPKGKVVSKVCSKVFTIKDVKNKDLFAVERGPGYFIVSGNKIEKFARRTNAEDIHSMVRFRDILKKMGIDKELRRLGATEGDELVVAGKKFKF